MRTECIFYALLNRSIDQNLSVDYLRNNFLFNPTDIIDGLASAPAYHLIFEALLLIWIVKLLFFTKTFNLAKSDLTEKEKHALIEEWQPEPLIPEVEEENPFGFKNKFTGIPGPTVCINGKEHINLTSLNFLNMIGNKEVEASAIDAVRKYGVGSCGPRGFYGTNSIHLELEENLAKFMNCEEAILYAYGFSTVASAIPAYAKRGDVLFVDEGVCFPVQKGVEASRSCVKYFKHNDMSDLERLLKEQAAEDLKNPRKAKVTRRFFIVEGVYLNYGDICPLPKLIELKYKYKVRLFIEESLSFGVLGDTGRGITQHFNCNMEDVDMVCANLEYAVGSIGGFCCGRSFVIDHQRLSGLGYCFSASLPPLLAAGAITALGIIDSSGDKLENLRSKASSFHQMLESISGVCVISDEISPVKHLMLSKTNGDINGDRLLLQKIVEYCMQNGVAVTQAQYIDQFEYKVPRPSIRLAVNVDLPQEDIKAAVDVLKAATKALL
ncbi:sptlc1 [Bugula neritina]|uniref:Serine palmitoyltransferase 1 n=1 Tax=Bugula neritina TaxID=10212 RepID=A0A7J7JNY8_BUGNE|nr:sptlc1 [Bugula neritina]